MTRLEDMSVGNRIMLTVAILIIILILVACVGYWTGRWDADVAAAEPAPVPSQYGDRLLALDREAIERAYSSQVQQLFATWMKDSTGQPNRALVGINNARRAFTQSMTAIERREQQQKQ
jgi:hypothetical protein